VLLPAEPENAAELEEWLRGLRGSRIQIRVPKRGDKAALLATVQENADQALALHKSRRAGDITTRSAGLQQLQEALGLPVALLRIECYDISHVQGTNVVASMVVVEDGLPKKSDYRRFSITGDAARDDTASMYDVISRRFRNYLADEAASTQSAPQHSGGGTGMEVMADTTTPAPRTKFAYPPNLVVVDGGPPQVAAASRALADLGITDIYVVGLAKRLEEVWLPDDEFPVILPRSSEGLYLLQRVRDEAHRFAISYHRQKRGKSMTVSILDQIQGLGPAKSKALLKHFGSAKRLKAAGVEALQQVPGIGPALAVSIRSQLDAAASAREEAGGQAPVVNMTTGEILES
jgi:excinuclease ABC subunit C